MKSNSLQMHKCADGAVGVRKIIQIYLKLDFHNIVPHESFNVSQNSDCYTVVSAAVP